MKKSLNILKKIFSYQESKNSYDFILPESGISNQINPESLALPDKSISTSLEENIEYLKVKYNAIINSDIVLRKFNLTIQNRTYQALLVLIDGMVDSELINNFLLKPLMNTQNKKISKSSYINCNGVTIRKTKKLNLENYIYENLVPQNSITKVENFDNIISFVNAGNCALLVDTLPIAFSVDVKGYKFREISTPNNEIVVRGSQEAFVEKIRVNTSLLRRLINNENLIIEDATVGKISKTTVAICYIKDIANSELVNEVKYRINNLNIDFIISSGQLEQFIQDNGNIAFPQMISTERPDKAAFHLLEGRVVVLVNGSPYSLIMPGVFIDFLSSPEDINLKHQYANLLKFVRIIATLITLLLPGIYVAISNFHVELLPTELLFTIAASRNAVPFPVIVEILVMEISFELIREAGLRVPTPIGPTIGIIGALVLGEAAVSANLVSPVLIIIVAITGICSFSIPDFSLSFSFRIFKFLYIILGYICGFLGIGIGLIIQLRNSF